MLRKSIISLILLAIIIPLAIIGGIPFALLIGVASIFIAKELTDLYKIPLIVKFLVFLVLISIVYSNFDASSILLGLNYQVLSGALLALMIPIVFFQVAGKYTIKDAFEIFGFVLLVGLGLNYLILIRNYNLWYFILMIAIPIVTDSFAFISGMLIGKHKVTKLSPKKSLEGYVIGSLMGTFLATVYYVLAIGKQENLLIIVGVILLLSIVGQIGDLFFSAIKRQYAIKDFSGLIPEHGGVLDRVDSIVFVALLFMILIRYL